MLLVRADDIPEYVQDGVVDCGITGLDLVRERSTHVDELLKLGFGSCRLEAAVPAESRYERLEDLEGATVATVFPRLTRELMPVPVELVEITGSVEVAPRLGLADAIVDLVSSGNTLRTNGLRSLGSLFSSEAVLIGREGADATQIVSMMRAVVEARAHRYLMLNAPHAELERVCEIIGSRSPSVLPLARGGHGRRARARAGEGRVAAAAAARGGGRLVDPGRARGADDAMSGADLWTVCRSFCDGAWHRPCPKRTRASTAAEKDMSCSGRSGYPPPAPMRSSLSAKSSRVCDGSAPTSSSIRPQGAARVRGCCGAWHRTWPHRTRPAGRGRKAT